MGANADYDFGILDHLLALFLAATIALPFGSVESARWIQGHPHIIAVIVGAVAITTISLSIAVNQSAFQWRFAFEALAFVIAYLSVPAIMWVSAHDLYPDRLAIMALPLGVAIWIIIREGVIFILNCCRSTRQQTATT
jgi:hypothetical protein